MSVKGRVGKISTIVLDEGDRGRKKITKGGIISPYLQRLYFFLAD